MPGLPIAVIFRDSLCDSVPTMRPREKHRLVIRGGGGMWFFTSTPRAWKGELVTVIVGQSVNMWASFVPICMNIRLCVPFPSIESQSTQAEYCCCRPFRLMYHTPPIFHRSVFRYPVFTP